ncbi:MAG: hypothetical protein WDM96_18160 [Lacunisphaera sp.]
MRPYGTVFSRQALEFVAAANDDTFAEINQWVDRIERAPSTLGDYTEQDADGRELQVTVLHQVAILYWPDHATCEVRVIRIEENR